MNRWIYGLLAAVCLVFAVILPARAADANIVDYAVTGGNIQFDKNSGTVTGSVGTVTEVDIPETIDNVSVVAIRDGAFKNCTSLTRVKIPASVESISSAAFFVCTSLTEITVEADNPFYSSIDGVLFNKNATVLHTYPGGKKGAYTIPNGVTTIGGWAFSYCTGLTGVSIPDRVISIDVYAFYMCTKLTSVSFPDGVTSIGDCAFNRCAGLTSVSIPSSMVSIGEDVFHHCSGLTEVSYNGTRAEYEAKLLPNISTHLNGNDEFLNAAFYFKDSPKPGPSVPPGSTFPNTEAGSDTIVYGIVFFILLLLTLTVWARGRNVNVGRKGANGK